MKLDYLNDFYIIFFIILISIFYFWYNYKDFD